MDYDNYRSMVSFKFPPTGPIVNISGLAGASLEQAREFLKALSEVIEEVANRE